MDEEQQKQANREAAKRYREKIKNDPQKHEERKAKQKEWNKLRMEAIKADPIKYADYLENERKRGKQKRIDTQRDPSRRENRNKYYKQYTENNKERVKKYQSRSSEQWKKRNLLRRYKITVEEYEKILQEQNGLCKICNIKPKKIVVDHCHKTGIVRGLLCNECNTAIGLLKENLQSLQNAIMYLTNTKD